MGPPAARLGDFHVCPMTPIPPGLPIIPPCMVTVLIGKRPAARVTDLCACVGPPPANVDPIVFGSPTVLIGKLPAARIGDPTLKGGIITTGEFTVLIGI
ncbi:PAAR domain-containing protein [Roseibium sp. M-1]